MNGAFGYSSLLYEAEDYGLSSAMLSSACVLSCKRLVGMRFVLFFQRSYVGKRAKVGDFWVQFLNAAEATRPGSHGM